MQYTHTHIHTYTHERIHKVYTLPATAFCFIFCGHVSLQHTAYTSRALLNKTKSAITFLSIYKILLMLINNEKELHK